MQETRRLRLQSVIQEELSVFVAREVKDPRVPMVTITKVEVTQDGGQATVWVSILGLSQEDQLRGAMKDCIAGLISAAGYMRRHLARVLNVRHIPNLIFKED